MHSITLVIDFSPSLLHIYFLLVGCIGIVSHQYHRFCFPSLISSPFPLPCLFPLLRLLSPTHSFCWHIILLFQHCIHFLHKFPSLSSYTTSVLSSMWEEGICHTMNHQFLIMILLLSTCNCESTALASHLQVIIHSSTDDHDFSTSQIVKLPCSERQTIAINHRIFTPCNCWNFVLEPYNHFTSHLVLISYESPAWIAGLLLFGNWLPTDGHIHILHKFRVLFFYSYSVTCYMVTNWLNL